MLGHAIYNYILLYRGKFLTKIECQMKIWIVISSPKKSLINVPLTAHLFVRLSNHQVTRYPDVLGG
jgi:hypothetical protein